MGNMIVELYWNHAPNTCRNFAELARRGYYNSTKFHRVVQNFIAQGGDPTGSGRGGSSIYGTYFNDEITPALKHTGKTRLVSTSNHRHHSQQYIDGQRMRRPPVFG